MKELKVFMQQPCNTRVLLMTVGIYALVLPVIEVFQAAYIMGQSADISRVLVYQLTVYSGIPITFVLNGLLLRSIRPAYLFVFGMLLSGVSMLVMTSLPELSNLGLAATGLIMGLSFGFFWSNRDYLVLVSTTDKNRNYYYGTESFFNTIANVIIPTLIGSFIVYYTKTYNLLEGNREDAYRLLAFAVILLTIFASFMVLKGQYAKPEQPQFLFLRFHRLWYWLLGMATLKGLVQGFIVTAPAILVFKFIGNEGALGSVQSISALVTALLMYLIGRHASPGHRLALLGVALALFVAGAVLNSMLFNATSVIIFLLCLVVARPLFDIAYFPIQLKVIDHVSGIEKRNEYAYIVNHEWGLYLGRLIGCGTFIAIAMGISDDAALIFTLPFVTILQAFSWFIARHILNKISAEKLLSPGLPPLTAKELIPSTPFKTKAT